MDWWITKLNRRKFLRYFSALTGAVFLPGALFKKDALAAKLGQLQRVKNRKNLAPHEKQHLIKIRIPLVAEDGANVPMQVRMDHPMEPDPYIQNIQSFNFNDLLISKGVYHFTPANGKVFLMVQLRMNAGDADVYVAAECSRDGKWVASRKLKVAVGGC